MTNLSKFQRFETQTIERAKLANAPYNPRKMSEAARKKLKAGMKRFGLAQPLVWNKRTGNLVGGHQRIAILDSLERSQDYSLTVAVVDLPLKDEVTLNVQMNNDGMMGEWDSNLLKQLHEEFEVPFADLGFEPFDVQVMFPELVREPTVAELAAKGQLEDIEVARVNAKIDAVDDGGDGASDVDVDEEMTEEEREAQHAEAIARLKAAKKEARDSLAEQNDTNFYFTVTCENRAECNGVLAMLGLPEDTKFVTGAIVRERLHRLSEGAA